MGRTESNKVLLALGRIGDAGTCKGHALTHEIPLGPIELKAVVDLTVQLQK